MLLFFAPGHPGCQGCDRQKCVCHSFMLLLRPPTTALETLCNRVPFPAVAEVKGKGLWPGPLLPVPEHLDPEGELSVGEMSPGWGLE